LFAAAGVLLIDGRRRFGKLRAQQIPVTRFQLVIAILRGYLAFVYHCCSFISRYYLIAVPVVMPLSPSTAAVMTGMHLIAGVVEYAVKRPRLNPVSFLIYFTLEQLSYQAGVWWECIHRVNFNPLLPRIIHKRI
ncbi:MAG: hypothetical protein PVF20_08860, partial [Desulfobacterales bacterium]